MTKVNKDGTYDVDYDDKERLEALDLTREELDERPPITVGLRVKTRYYGELNWFDAVVTDIDNEGFRERFYKILYDDGDEEIKVPARYITSVLATGTLASSPPSMRMGPTISTLMMETRSTLRKPSTFDLNKGQRNLTMLLLVKHTRRALPRTFKLKKKGEPDHIMSRSDMESQVQQTKCIGVREERAKQPDACLSNVAALRPRPAPESNTSQGPTEKRRKLDDDTATVTSHESSTPPTTAGVAVKCPCRCIIL